MTLNDCAALLFYIMKRELSSTQLEPMRLCLEEGRARDALAIGLEIADRYGFQIPEQMRRILKQHTPKLSA